MIDLNSTSIAVNDVIGMLHFRKEEAVEFLFPDADDRYKKEWMGRDTFLFWARLDENNRRRLIRMSISVYAPYHMQGES